MNIWRSAPALPVADVEQVEWTEAVAAIRLDETWPVYESQEVYALWRSVGAAEFSRLLAYRRAVRAGLFSDAESG
jgi:hypothetical protein